MLRNGFPEREVVERLDRDAVVRAMREHDRRFLEANAAALDHYVSRWVPDPMHNWSRPWEYLFTHERIVAFAGRAGSAALRVLDAGSGLTFFPHFLVARYPDFRVTCVDNDERLVRDADQLAPPAEPSVRYRAGDLASIEGEPGAFDVVYCVSVLEHVPDTVSAVAHLAALLRPHGRLVLTVDISLDGDAEIPREAAARLVDALGEALEPEADYLALFAAFDERRHYTTEHARRRDPTLLPWAPPRFHRLTCFGMSFTRLG